MIWLLFLPALFHQTISHQCISDHYLSCGENDLQGCIHKDWWCDGNPDCDSGIDERNCALKCADNEIRCSVIDQCIPSIFHCDGISQCFDGSDEVGCKIESVQRCDPLKEFDCKNDGRLCIPLKQVCDGHNDCGRNEDEMPGGKKENCQRDNCRLTPNGGCNHNCINRYADSVCACRNGFFLGADNKTCVDIDECANNPPICSQKCTNKKGSYECSCYEGYELAVNSSSECIANGERSVLISLHGNEMVNIDINNNNHRTVLATFTIDNFDLDLRNNKILFATENNDQSICSILRVERNADKTSFRKQLIFQVKNSECRGITYDWTRGLLFWTSKTEKRIYVTNTTSNETSVFLDKGIASPHSIVVNPFETRLYWIDWSSDSTDARILTMLLRDTQPQVLVSKGLHQPMDLYLDILENRLYWCDVKPGSISYVNLLNSSVSQSLVSNALFYPFSIKVFENRVYWADWRQNQILSVRKLSGDDVKSLGRFHKPYTIRFMNKVLQPEIHKSLYRRHACLTNLTNRCSSICLPHPPSENPSSTCICPLGSVLFSDNQKCQNSNQIMFPENVNRAIIIKAVMVSLIVIIVISASVVLAFICRQRKNICVNKVKSRKAFGHPIITGDLMFMFKCSSHSSQLSELLSNDCNSVATT